MLNYADNHLSTSQHHQWSSVITPRSNATDSSITAWCCLLAGGKTDMRINPSCPCWYYAWSLWCYNLFSTDRLHPALLHHQTITVSLSRRVGKFPLGSSISRSSSHRLQIRGKWLAWAVDAGVLANEHSSWYLTFYTTTQLSMMYSTLSDNAINGCWTWQACTVLPSDQSSVALWSDSKTVHACRLQQPMYAVYATSQVVEWVE